MSHHFSNKPAYPGYPRYVVLAFPKSGTKTMNKVFSSLGYKVFDVMQVPDYAVQVRRVIQNKTMLT